MEFPPNDLKLALLEAGGGKVGTSFQRFLLSCFQYDPARRSYALFVRRFIQGGGLLVFFALAGMLSVLWRREWKAGTVR